MNEKMSKGYFTTSQKNSLHAARRQKFGPKDSAQVNMFFDFTRKSAGRRVRAGSIGAALN